MKQRFLWLIILIVLLPVGLLTWFGVRFASTEKVVTQQRFQQLMQERLSDVNRQVAAQFDAAERALQQVTAFDAFQLDEIREIVRTRPQVSQIFVLRSDGELLYPQPGSTLNVTERSFLQQASKMFTGKDLQNAVALREAELLRGPQGASIASGSNWNGRGSPAPADSNLQNFENGTATTPQIANLLPTFPQVSPTEPGPLPFPESAVTQSLPSAGNFTVPPAASAGTRRSAIPLPGRGMTSPQSNALDSPIDPLQPAPAQVAAAQTPQVETAVEPQANLPQSLSTPLGGNRPAVNAKFNAFAQQRVAWPQSSGWFVWYWDRGMNLIYWQRRPSGLIVGAALERSRWISDLICALPETDQTRKVTDAVSFRVVGSASETIYTWGPEWPGNAPAYCELPLANPLASWRLQCFVPATLIPNSGRSLLFNLIAGLGAVTLTLSAMGWVLYRDYSRDMREASQQVSFVNQVSHELKTPLTNIRMYAELLEKDIENLIPEELAAEARSAVNDPRRRLDVITSEAQRLSRLIGNVLTFARQQRKTLQLQPQPVNAVEVIRNIVERFAPSLAEHQIAARVSGSIPGTHTIDTDFLEQILGNLISNVEKYAAGGGVLQVHVAAEDACLLIDVTDAGPGIPSQYREEVFRPFARLDNDVRSASGTGIGLTIARELARQHGGDLLLMNSDKGCWFRIQLRSL